MNKIKRVVILGGLQLVDSVGDMLRNIRLKKGLTLSYVAKGIMSDSHLGKVERNETTTNAENFLAIINKLNISYDEMLYEEQSGFFYQKRQLMIAYSEAFTEMNVVGLKMIKQEAKNLKKASDDASFIHLEELATAAIKLLESNFDYQSVQHELSEVKKYLLDSNYWSLYDFILLNNSIYAFEPSFIIIAGKKAERLLEGHNNTQMKFVAASFFYNCCTILVEQKDFVHAQLFAEMCIRVAQKNLLGFQLISAQIMAQLIAFKLQKKSFDEKLLSQYLAALKLMAPENFYQNTCEICEEILGGKENETV